MNYYVAIRIGVSSLRLNQEIKKYYKMRKVTKLKPSSSNTLITHVLGILFSSYKNEIHLISEDFYVHLSLTDPTIISSAVSSEKLDALSSDLYNNLIELAEKHEVNTNICLKGDN